MGANIDAVQEAKSGLFKYILANQKPQPREYLASIFQKDSNRKSAYTSLRVAIYELRTSMSSTEPAFDKEASLLEENEEGFFKSTLYHIKSDANYTSICFEAVHSLGRMYLSQLNEDRSDIPYRLESENLERMQRLQ